MKILLLCNKLPYPTNDGSSIAIARMIEGFISQNCHVSVLSLNTKKHFKDANNIPKEVLDKAHFSIIDVNTNPTARGAFANLFQKLPFHVNRFYQAEVALKLEQLLTEQEFDIVQIEGIFMMPYLKLIREKSSAKIALRTHNIEHQIWQRAIENTTQHVLKVFLKTQTKKLIRYENWCAKEADFIVAISINDENYFKKLNPHSITIPCGIPNVRPIDHINNHHFFHLGAMDWMPNKQGVNWLVNEVWPIVYAANSKLTLHLAGRAMDDKLLHLKQEGIQVHGEIENAKTFRAKYGIMLVPLLAGSGIRIKIIEGIAEGIPVISTSIGAEGIDATQGKEMILADSAQEFAEAMLLLANNIEKCESIGKNAANLASENFMNNNLASKLVAFYSSVWQTS